MRAGRRRLVRNGSLALAAGALAAAAALAANFRMAASLPPQSRPKERWALFVGRDEGGAAVTPLQQRIAQALRDDYGYHQENVLELYNGRATAAAVADAMGSLSSRMNPTDTLFVYIALRAVAVASDIYFVPAGGREAEPWTLLPTADFDKFLASFPAQNALILYPSCLRPARLAGDAASQKAPSSSYGSYSRAAPARTVSLLNYCAPADGAVAFARSVASALRGEAGGTDAKLTAAELSEHLRNTGYGVTLGKSPPYSSDEFAFVRTRGRLDPFLAALEGSATPEAKTRAIDALVKAALSEAPDHREHIVADARGALLPLVTAENGDGAVRARAASALADLGDRESAAPLARVLGTTRDTALRKSIVDALTRLGGPEAAPAIRRALSDSSPAVRVAAIRSVAYLKDEGSLRRVLVLFSDANDEVRIAALQTSVTFPSHGDEVRAAVAPLLQTSSADVRREAVSALGSLGRAPVTRDLVPVLQSDPDASVRQAAAYALARTFPPADRSQAESALIRALSDAEAPVQEAAAWALGEVGGEAVERQLIRTVRERGTDDRVRKAAAESLGRMKSVAAVPSLVELLKSGAPEVKQAAAASLGAIGDSRAVEPLLAALKDPNAYVRAEAEKALRLVKSGPAGGNLTANLRDSSPRVRQETVQKIAQSGPRGASGLIPALGDEDYNVREAAIEALAESKDADTAAKVVRALQDRSFLVRRGAAEVLGRTARPEGQKALLAAARDRDPTVRAEVVRSLGKFPSSEARSAVLAATRDADSEVREAAAEALGRYGTADAMQSLRQLAMDPAPNVRSKAVEALRQKSRMPVTAR